MTATFPTTINLIFPETVPEITNSAYIHIPFCRRRCYYCDFPISVLGDKARGENSGSIEQYVEVLCAEISQTTTPKNQLETVFFGGGTPSLLSVQQLERILATLDRYFGISPRAEISLEIDPGTFTRNQLRGYYQAGVNRVSLGVQAFQDEILQICGRSHNTTDIFAAIDIIRQVGIANFSLDLISGLPHQTLARWEESLENACQISPAHVSCYDLVLEPVTAFGRKYQPGTKPLPTDKITAQMYRQAQQILSSYGYQHYEISNYARSGFQCRHNRVYWENRPYYGFGMGAASYVNRQRFTRPRTRKEYYAWVEAGCEIDVPKSDANDVLLETLMLGLRLAEGINLAWINQYYGQEIIKQIWDCLQPYYQQGWVEIIDAEIEVKERETLPVIGRLKLSDPDGFLFSNTILSALFSRLE
ncbi:MAG: radical SAM family heme chaperone HemW [Oscillatoria sp. PMC 1051.18]|nr:radical SAM family heme chaperone HemW [Oscillatoria sp. PMC 1050.18]MEC5028895.1 radical SAM family heme chaperone HemW [Oscillatoria sp. PMC 1051.18]